MSERTGTAFILIHHAGKPKEGHSDGRTLPRGSGAIFDGCGAVFTLTATPPPKDEPEDKNAPRRVSQTKLNPSAEGALVDDFFLTVEDVRVGDHLNAGVRVRYLTAEQVRPPKAPGAAFVAAVDKILVFIRANPGVPGVERIAEMMGRRAAFVRQAVSHLLESGAIVDRGTTNPKRPRLFAVEASQ